MQSINSEMVEEELTIKDFVIKLKNWLDFLKSKTKQIIIIGLIGGILGTSIAHFIKPNFTAILTFAMEDDKGSTSNGLGGALGLASSFGIDLPGSSGGGAFAASNLSELMKSRLIIEKVLLSPCEINGKIITLADYYIEINNLKNKWRNNSKISNINFPINSERSKFTLQQDSILFEIRKNLINKNNLIITQKDKKVSIISIEVINKNELFAKIFCEYLAKETSEFYIETKSKKAKNNVDVLQKQVDSVKNQLNYSIKGVASEIDNVYNLNPAFNIKGVESKKRQVDVQSNTAILTNLVVQLELAKINLRKETPLIQLIDHPILPLENDNLNKPLVFLLGFLVGIFFAIINLALQMLYKKWFY